METTILKVLVGSQAHGLANPDSDYDYRGVYVTSTSEILSLNHQYKGSKWIEGESEDNTSWEIKHFLELAVKCNYNILEVFKAPIIESHRYDKIVINAEAANTGRFLEEKDLGKELRELFPYLWNPKDAFTSFIGYAENQEKKMRANKDGKWNKFAIAGLRTLFNLCDLLETETFSLKIEDISFREVLLNIKAQTKSQGFIINMSDEFKKRAKKLLIQCKHKPNLEKINGFLLKVRKEF